MNKPLVTLKDISFSYKDDFAIKDISFSIYKNDFLTIIGPNGSGKSTIIKIILGLLKANSGSINEGQTLSYGYLPQLNSIDRRFPITVRNIVFSGLVAKKGMFHFFKNEDRKKVDECLERVGMLKYSKRSINELSGGELQRVFLARSIVSNPDILILDEPDAYIDKTFQNNLIGSLKELNNDSNTAIVLVSHDINMIMSITKEIMCLNKTIFYYGAKDGLTKDIINKAYSNSSFYDGVPINNGLGL